MKLNKLKSDKVSPVKILAIQATALLIILSAMPMANAYGRQNLSLGHDYGTTSPFCLNCHDLSQLAKLEQSLLPTIDATCITCHDIHRATPDDMRHRTRNRPIVGTASKLTAYKINTYSKYRQNGHRLGAGFDVSLIGKVTTAPEKNILPVSNRKTATKNSDWRYWQAAYEQNSPPLSVTSPSTSIMTCNSCHAAHAGQNLSVSATSTTSQPGLSASTLSSSTTTEIELCLSCHPTYASNGGNNHNHPDRFCLDCHGDTASSSSNQDFPHSGSYNLLTDYSEALCLRCHISESLP